MGALAAVLIPFIPGLIRGVEQAFAAKAKSGPDKILAVIRALGQIPEQMINAKVPLPDGTQIAAASISDEFLKGLVEAEFQRLSVAGKVPIPPAGDLYLVRGSVVTIPTA